MNISLLHAFLADQRQAKQLVSAKLGIPENIRAMDWVSRHAELQQAYAARPFADIFQMHGYGLELQVGDVYIDFDYSNDGWPDGFDAWRIFVYIMAGQYDNRGPDAHISDRVDEWFERLIQQGRIEKRDNLYYFATQTASDAEARGE